MKRHRTKNVRITMSIVQVLWPCLQFLIFSVSRCVRDILVCIRPHPGTGELCWLCGSPDFHFSRRGKERGNVQNLSNVQIAIPTRLPPGHWHQATTRFSFKPWNQALKFRPRLVGYVGCTLILSRSLCKHAPCPFVGHGQEFGKRTVLPHRAKRWARKSWRWRAWD